MNLNAIAIKVFCFLTLKKEIDLSSNQIFKSNLMELFSVNESRYPKNETLKNNIIFKARPIENYL